jgi:hypothetical protein
MKITDSERTRLFGKIVKRRGCWEWKGEKRYDGYSLFRIRVNGKQRTFGVHRLLWLLTYGDVLPGFFVMHKCDNPSCVRLDHLYLGTHQNNMDDMKRKGRHKSGNTVKTHCKRGHPLSGDNVVWNRNRTQRHCKLCDRFHQLARRKFWSDWT